jgi:hypothetical protein
LRFDNRNSTNIAGPARAEAAIRSPPLGYETIFSGSFQPANGSGQYAFDARHFVCARPENQSAWSALFLRPGNSRPICTGRQFAQDSLRRLAGTRPGRRHAGARPPIMSRSLLRTTSSNRKRTRSVLSSTAMTQQDSGTSSNPVSDISSPCSRRVGHGAGAGRSHPGRVIAAPVVEMFISDAAKGGSPCPRSETGRLVSKRSPPRRSGTGTGTFRADRFQGAG